MKAIVLLEVDIPAGEPGTLVSRDQAEEWLRYELGDTCSMPWPHPLGSEDVRPSRCEIRWVQ